MTQDLISVIVPIYNVEKYLRTCLNSLLEQTYENFEVLMINDGSTDGSAAICQEYAERDSRFVYFEKENGGLASARNFGLDYSKGMYISFIDSDDWVVETYLLDLYNAIVKSKSDISISHHIGYKDDTGDYCIYIYMSILKKSIALANLYQNYLLWNYKVSYIILVGVNYSEKIYLIMSGLQKVN